MAFPRSVGVLVLLVVASSLSWAGTEFSGSGVNRASSLTLQFGNSFPSVAVQEITKLAQQVEGTRVKVADSGLNFWVPDENAGSAVVLSCGATGTFTASDVSTHGLPPESTAIKSLRLGDGGMVIVAAGTGSDYSLHTELLQAPQSNEYPRGDVYACFEALELLGFGFLKPQKPFFPSAVMIPSADVNKSASPQWPIRTWHVHTQHFIEYTEMLNGFTPSGGGIDSREEWQQSLNEWTRLLMWMVANKQNRVEWCLLQSKDYKDFAESDERQARLQILNNMAHTWGLATGVDAPLALLQQNAFSLVRKLTLTSMAAQLKEMRGRLQWLHDSGYDYISSESGTTEFTHPNDKAMLDLMDGAAVQAHEIWDGNRQEKTRILIKVHCSDGQKASHYSDPVHEHEKCDFNRLPYYSNPLMGVLPHTVQLYSLDDPAPTYGNTNFTDIRTYMHKESGRRTVVFYPETAYWVNYDINVPLFLPLYGERRLHDLRLIRRDEIVRKDFKIDGQCVFFSGSEFGYWLNDIVAARAAYDPIFSHPIKVEDESRSERSAYEAAISPAVSVISGGDMNGKLATEFTRVLCDIVEAEQRLLIDGVSGGSHGDVVRKNGMAYLQGWESFSEVVALLGERIAPTQPAKLQMWEKPQKPYSGDKTITNLKFYLDSVQPLLKAMKDEFGVLAKRLDSLKEYVPNESMGLFKEVSDSMSILAARSLLQWHLYEHVFNSDSSDHLDEANKLVSTVASEIIHRRVEGYAVPKERVAGWHSREEKRNPTVYPMSYLWTASTLYYWKRDVVRATYARETLDNGFTTVPDSTPEKGSLLSLLPELKKSMSNSHGKERSPCYWNIYDPIVTALGDGFLAVSLAKVAKWLRWVPWVGDYSQCLAPDFTLQEKLPVL